MKSSDDGYFADEFRRIGERYGNLRVIMVPEDVFGFVSADYVAESSGGLTDKDIFICGPPIMIDSLRSQFAAKGVPHGRLHYELFGFVR